MMTYAMRLYFRLEDFLSGKKAIIVGLLMVLLGFLQGDQDLMLEGFAVVAIRLGIKKAEKKRK